MVNHYESKQVLIHFVDPGLLVEDTIYGHGPCRLSTLICGVAVDECPPPGYRPEV